MDKLTIKQKVNLFKDLYTELAAYGTLGDTELAHVNKYEAAVLKAMGGSGTVNEVTGLKQYGGFFGDDDPAPAPAPTSTTVRQVSDLPEYFKPYAEKVLATAEQVYDKPYVPYEDRRLAPVTEEQQLSFTGLRDLFTGVDPTTGERQFRSPTAGAFETAQGLAGKGAAQFGELEEGVFEEKYMSPYTKAVTDIQVREAERRGEEQRKQLASSAMKAGALGSSRFGVQEALRGEGQQRLLSDIEQQGLQRSFEQGRQAFDADRAAARAGATQYGSLGTQEQASGLTGLGALQTTGETQRAIGQQPLDVSYEEFVRQQNYPRQSLQELGGILRGFPVTPSTYQTSQRFEQAPTLGSQLLTAGTLGAGIAKGLGKSLLGAGGGLMDVLPEGYVHGGDVVPPELRSSHPDINRPTIRVEDLDDRFLARLTDDQLEAFIQISNYSSDEINELIIKRNRILGKDAPIRTPIPRPPTPEERQRRIQTLSDRIEPLAPTREEAAAIEGWKQFEPEAGMIDVGLTQTPEERVVDKLEMEKRANEATQRRVDIQSKLLDKKIEEGVVGIEEVGEDAIQGRFSPQDPLQALLTQGLPSTQTARPIDHRNTLGLTAHGLEPKPIVLPTGDSFEEFAIEQAKQTAPVPPPVPTVDVKRESLLPILSGDAISMAEMPQDGTWEEIIPEETPVWGKGMTGIEEMDEDDPQKMKSRFPNPDILRGKVHPDSLVARLKKARASTTTGRRPPGARGLVWDKEQARKKTVKNMPITSKGKHQETRERSEQLLETLAKNAVPAAVEEGKVSPVPARTTDAPIFDLTAALPFFEMAAEFGKSGRSTADSAKAALAGFEKTTSARAASKVEADYKKGLTYQAKALGKKALAYEAIAKAQAGAKLTQDERVHATNYIKLMLESIDGQVGTEGFFQMTPELQKQYRAITRMAINLGTSLETIAGSLPGVNLFNIKEAFGDVAPGTGIKISKDPPINKVQEAIKKD